MDSIERMLEYLKTRDKELLVPCDYDIDEKTLTVIVTNILSWIKLEKKRELWKSQGRRAENKPMEINVKYPWCASLCKLVEVDGLFKEIFCIK